MSNERSDRLTGNLPHWYNKHISKVGCAKCYNGMVDVSEDKSWGLVEDCECVKLYEKHKKTLKVLQGCPNMSEHLWSEATEEKCRENVKNFSEVQDKCRTVFKGLAGSLYLYGKPNVGKTLTAAYIAKVFAENGREVQFDTIGGMLSAFKNFNDNASEYFEKCRRTPVLIIDDFGTEKVTEWTDSTIFTIINDRYLFGGFTLITGNNLPRDKFSGNIEDLSVADRVASKILRKYEILKLT